MDREFIRLLEGFLDASFFRIIALFVIFWIGGLLKGWVHALIIKRQLRSTGIVTEDKKVTIDGSTGIVDRFGLYHVKLKDYDGNRIIYIPIKKLLESSNVAVEVDFKEDA